MDLAAYLTEHKIKPATFAAQISVPPSTITRILRGERDPRGATIRKIVDGTGGVVTAGELLTGCQPMIGDESVPLPPCTRHTGKELPVDVDCVRRGSFLPISTGIQPR